MQLDNALRTGITLTGSGTTSVTTPRFFRGVRAVTVTTADATQSVTPAANGSLSFTVDLGAPHQHQEYTPAADFAGEDKPGYFTTRTVTFARERLASGGLSR
jgi:hypothetical protein